MPVLDIDPGQSPEAPGVLSFFRQGADPSTGVQLTTEGQVIAPGGQEISGNLEVGGGLDVTGPISGTDNLTVTGYADLASGQFVGTLTLWSGTTPLVFGTAGGGISIKEGANATMGTATLTAGTVTVNTTKVTANSRIFLTSQATGGTPGWVRVSARTAGTSFTITSSSGTDTSPVAWLILEPAA